MQVVAQLTGIDVRGNVCVAIMWLSDEQVEYWIKDRTSFREIIGILREAFWLIWRN